MVSDNSHTYFVIPWGEVVTQLPAGVTCWCSRALESPYLQHQLVKQFCHKKISITPALFFVCLGTGTVPACGQAGRWGVCGGEVVKPCPAPLSCLCSVAARTADGPSARAAGASVLLFPALETLSRRCARSAMENWLGKTGVFLHPVSHFFSSVYVPCGVADFGMRALPSICAWMLPGPRNFKTGHLWTVVIWAVQSKNRNQDLCLFSMVTK